LSFVIIPKTPPSRHRCWPLPKTRLGCVLVFLLLVAASSHPSWGQASLTGVVADAATHAGLPSVTIRLKRAGSGTMSQVRGAFTLPIPSAAAADTVVFSNIGYTSLAVALQGISSTQPQRFLLKKKQVALAPVAVTMPKLVERKFGIASQKALVHFTDGTMRPGEAFEIAQVLDVGQPQAQLTSVNLFLAASQPDSATVTIHFYGFDGSRPTQELGPAPPARRVAVRAGWLRLALPPQLPALPRVFVVGLAVVPASATSKPLPYEIKLGGSTQSFARTPKNAGWRVPPHHYRLYVTALVPSTAPVEDAAALETPPTRHLYSAAVQDSFALYIQLPKGYRPSQNRTYPVVFLLDANVYFEAVKAQLAKLTPVILVGIGYRDIGLLDSLRQRDYTYPLAAPADSFPVSGGGQRFLAFLTQELIPYVDHQYKTDPGQRSLLGHSLGGYFAVYALLEGLKTGQPAFTHYVAASPSLYYGDAYLRRQLAALPAAKEPRTLPTLYLTVGERELERGDAERLAVKAAFVAFTQELAAHQTVALTWHRITYSNAGHLETALPSFADGLKAFCKSR
jgi:predicted alpha/beta superfamily hydrolase